MSNLPKIGTTIEATRPDDSFYNRVRGIVTAHRNGRIQIEATEVITKQGTQWQRHPTACAMGVSARDIIAK